MAAPDYLKDFVTDFAQQAKTSFAVPLDPSTFMGRQFVEGLDPLQTQAIGLAQQGVGSFQPFLTSAQQAITQAGQDVAGLRQFAGAGAGTGAGSIAAFQSPFQQQVIDETLRQFDMERARGRRGIQDAAVAVGGFGGGREGVQLAEFDSDTLANRAGIRAGLLQQGFQDAAARRQQAFANQQALAAAQAGLAGQQFGLSNFARQGLGQDISALGSLGALRQSQNQALLRADQQLAQASAMEPLGRLERYGQAVTSVTPGTIGAPPMPPQQLPNPAATALSNALGIGNLFANIYGAMRPRT
jgi:hypothetical protein